MAAPVSSLISCEWLKDQIDKGLPKNIVLLDVSWSSMKNCRDDYLKCHIPGAVFINILEAEHTDTFPRNIPKEDVFERNVQLAGIDADTHVILYSDSDGAGYFLSGRAWWTFKLYGHTKVSILDGGLQKWNSLGYFTSSESPQTKKGSFKSHWTGKYYRSFDEVKNNLEKNAFKVFDCRASGAYHGNDSSGHISGAGNLPYGNLIDMQSLTLKSSDKLLKELENVGIAKSDKLVTYCNSGMSSCTVSFVAELCGMKDVAVYHGGFTEWKSMATTAKFIEK